MSQSVRRGDVFWANLIRNKVESGRGRRSRGEFTSAPMHLCTGGGAQMTFRHLQAFVLYLNTDEFET